MLSIVAATAQIAPPPPVPRPPVTTSPSWLISNEGESCTARCLRSGATCDLALLLSVDTSSEIKDVALLAGVSDTINGVCIGGDVGWAYASNPGMCTHGRCCGDANHDGIGDCEGICAYGSYGVTRTCEATNSDYSRFCPCALEVSPSTPPPPAPPYTVSPPPPMPRPPLSVGDWILAEEGTSCNQECAVSGGVCDETRLSQINDEATIRAAAAAAGVDCSGGTVGWSYPSNPGICTHGRCCGDADNDGFGDCEGICAYGYNAQTSCATINQDYSRLCACNPTFPRPPPPPPLPPGRTNCRSSSECQWPQHSCVCNDAYVEGPGGSVIHCEGGQCILARDYTFSVVQAGGSCVGDKIWWRHQYTSTGPTDTTLNADLDTGDIEVAATYAAAEPRCGGGSLIQWSPAYSWEWSAVGSEPATLLGLPRLLRARLRACGAPFAQPPSRALRCAGVSFVARQAPRPSPTIRTGMSSLSRRSTRRRRWPRRRRRRLLRRRLPLRRRPRWPYGCYLP